MIQNELYIHHHLGLGDMIHMNGMVRRILREKNLSRIYVFSKNCHKKMTEWMYRDEPKIFVIGIDETSPEIASVNRIVEEQKGKLLRVGHVFVPPTIPCDIFFYNMVDIPYSSRFDDCYWQRDFKEEERVYKKLAPNNKDYVFVHDDPDRGFIISNQDVSSNLEIIRNDKSESIFHLSTLLENAKEIHLMESSIRCMIEYLKPKLVENQVKLYFHDIRGTGPQYDYKNDTWNGTNLCFNLVKYG